MKRVLAALVAAALVAGALVVRTQLTNNEDRKDRHPKHYAAGTVATLACAPELMAVCDAAASKEVRVLPDSLDLNNAATNASKVDAWLTYGPAPGMVNAAASGQPKLFDTGTVVAAGRLGVVTPSDRGGALAKGCRVSKLTWACLVRSAGQAWQTIAPGGQFQGTVKVGVGRPASALGTVLVGPAALATARQKDPGIDEIDVNAVGRLVGSVEQTAAADELRDLTTQGPAAFSVVVAPEQAAERAAGSTRGQELGLVVLYPDPVAKTVVVLATPSGREVPLAIVDAILRSDVKNALTGAGWAPINHGSTAGLPAPDVLYALNRALSR